MKFSGFNLKKDLINNLNKVGYIDASKVQELVIPKALKNENIIVQSHTGSGKTHSFIVPILNNLLPLNKVQSIILCPTRELAEQTYSFINELNIKPFNFNIKIFISGKDLTKDIKSIKNGCDVIICTPNRLNNLKQYLNESNCKLNSIVLDEIDMLMDQDFLADIDEIINSLKPIQIMVFSATIDNNIEAFLKKYISADHIINVDNKFNSSSVKHHLLNIKHLDYYEAIEKFIKIINPFLLMVFSNTKKEAEDLYKYFYQNKYDVCYFSGDLSLKDRNNIIREIKNNKYQIIFCTDIASRGLDINDVSEVISLNIPNNIEYYYHRAGRTGRFNKNGDSYIFINDKSFNIDKITENLDYDKLIFKKDKIVLDEEYKIKKRIINNELEKEIKKTINFSKPKQVKPGYKKKIQYKVNKVKNKYKRKAIKQKIQKQINDSFKKH